MNYPGSDNGIQVIARDEQPATFRIEYLSQEVWIDISLGEQDGVFASLVQAEEMVASLVARSGGDASVYRIVVEVQS